MPAGVGLSNEGGCKITYFGIFLLPTLGSPPAGPQSRGVELLQEGRDIELQGACHLQKLDHIQASLAAFDFGHKGLRTLELGCKFDLRQPRRLAGLDQERAEAAILLGIH
jgi:hypothetical protein